MKLTYIYTLSCPVTLVVRYVGKTTNLASRLKGHLRNGEQTHCARWIRSLTRCGLVPTLETIEVCRGDNWASREQFWIKHYRDKGASLTNLTDGGDGRSNLVIADSTRRLLSIASKGRVSCMKGKRHSEETKAKIREHSRVNGGTFKVGHVISKETRAKMSASHFGKPGHWTGIKRDAEFCRKRSEHMKLHHPMKGKHHSEEAKRKISQANKKNFAARLDAEAA